MKVTGKDLKYMLELQDSKGFMMSDSVSSQARKVLSGMKC